MAATRQLVIDTADLLTRVGAVETPTLRLVLPAATFQAAMAAEEFLRAQGVECTAGVMSGGAAVLLLGTRSAALVWPA